MEAVLTDVKGCHAHKKWVNVGVAPGKLYTLFLLLVYSPGMLNNGTFWVKLAKNGVLFIFVLVPGSFL